MDVAPRKTIMNISEMRRSFSDDALIIREIEQFAEKTAYDTRVFCEEVLNDHLKTIEWIFNENR